MVGVFIVGVYADVKARAFKPLPCLSEDFIHLMQYMNHSSYFYMTAFTPA